MHRRTLLGATLAAGVPRLANAAVKPVVLELFTSQGCSSCPPADALLGKLAQRPDVIALAWHVDYWNHLGWRDPFASRRATQRQQAYSRQIGTEVFTPALVVDGVTTVVGADRPAVERAIRAAPALPVSVSLSHQGDDLVADISAASGPLRALRISYDPEHATDIGAGENGGARLREYRIVREFDVLGEWDGSSRRFNINPAGPARGLVVLVQGVDLRVVGAADQPPAGRREVSASG